MEGKRNLLYAFLKEDSQETNASIVDLKQRIQYEDPYWVVYDGDGTKPSTNGTWIFMEDSKEIIDGMIFKAAQTMFQAKIITHIET